MPSLLLHMHQPDYRHPATGVPIMPWVRLHGTRGYRDVPRIIAESGAQVTVNLVATLVEQIDHYAQGGSDRHLDLCRKPAEALSDAEAKFVREQFLHGSDRAYGWFAGWGKLRARRERGERFSTQHLRDLQVWCNLAWFGATAVEDFPELTELRRKGHGFSEADKVRVLALQQRCLADLQALYAALPDVSASPFAHPILPLLVNSGHARRNLGDFPDPGFVRPEDALSQLKIGRDVVSRWTGRNVVGLWPSEGSVSPEALELASDAGFEWFASDEGVLARSERTGSGPVWEVGPLRGFFRDHGLSDRIGFVYSDWPGEAAAADLAQQIGEREVVLALDGENPWESHRDAGAGFLRALFGQVQFTACAQLAQRAPTGKISHLHTGSWIGADFRIWIGHESDQTAWRWLREVRDACQEQMHKPEVQTALHRAEASDWFWWYGPEFSTPFAGDFDLLFRAHLQAACEAAGAPVPEAVKHPLVDHPRTSSPPTGPVYPGRSDWFAWANAGFVQLSGGSMALGEGAAIRVEFGWSDQGFVYRLDAPAGWRVEVVPDAASRNINLYFVGPDGTRHPRSEPFTLVPPPAPANVG